MRKGSTSSYASSPGAGGPTSTRPHRPLDRGGMRLGTDAVASGAAGRVAGTLAPRSGVSIPARVIRQFEAPHELVTLERVIKLPALATMGTRLDLRNEGMEAPLAVVGWT